MHIWPPSVSVQRQLSSCTDNDVGANQNKAMISNPQHKRNFDMQCLKLNHLNTFAQLLVHGRFSAAAKRQGLTQPAVSLQIRQLETRLNLKLIERVGKRIKPTLAGSTLLEHIGRIDAAVEDALLDLSSHALGIVRALTSQGPPTT